MKKLRRAILLTDIHYPDHIRANFTAIEPFIKDFKPDIFVYMGDQLDLDMISSWNESKPRNTEMKRLNQDYKKFDVLFLRKHEKLAPKARRIWIDGNHCQRADWYVDKHPAFEGMIEPRNVLKLAERGYKVIKFGGYYKLGKLIVIHGKYWNVYHAAKTVNMFENSVVYAHTHNPQIYAKTVPIDTGKYHIATSLGCLSSTTPEYKAGRATRWINQFAVVYLDDKGSFWLYPITIVNGKFIFNSKIYG